MLNEPFWFDNQEKKRKRKKNNEKTKPHKCTLQASVLPQGQKSRRERSFAQRKRFLLLRICYWILIPKVTLNSHRKHVRYKY